MKYELNVIKLDPIGIWGPQFWHLTQFPSRAVVQARLHGLDPKEVLLPIEARDHEDLLRTEDIVSAIEVLASDHDAAWCSFSPAFQSFLRDTYIILYVYIILYIGYCIIIYIYIYIHMDMNDIKRRFIWGCGGHPRNSLFRHRAVRHQGDSCFIEVVWGFLDVGLFENRLITPKSYGWPCWSSISGWKIDLIWPEIDPFRDILHYSCFQTNPYNQCFFTVGSFSFASFHFQVLHRAILRRPNHHKRSSQSRGYGFVLGVFGVLRFDSELGKVAGNKWIHMGGYQKIYQNISKIILIRKVWDEKLSHVMLNNGTLGVYFWTNPLFQIASLFWGNVGLRSCCWQCRRRLGFWWTGFTCSNNLKAEDLKLHEWEVDGACWSCPQIFVDTPWIARTKSPHPACWSRCNYKYLNSGPGAIGGFFVHRKHHDKGATQQSLSARFSRLVDANGFWLNATISENAT